MGALLRGYILVGEGGVQQSEFNFWLEQSKRYLSWIKYIWYILLIIFFFFWNFDVDVVFLLHNILQASKYQFIGSVLKLCYMFDIIHVLL